VDRAVEVASSQFAKKKFHTPKVVNESKGHCIFVIPIPVCYLSRATYQSFVFTGAFQIIPFHSKSELDAGPLWLLPSLFSPGAWAGAPLRIIQRPYQGHSKIFQA